MLIRSISKMKLIPIIHITELWDNSFNVYNKKFGCNISFFPFDYDTTENEFCYETCPTFSR